ncbi:MAG: hypothetical protein LBH30_03200 [Prevotellaceae bacterium]|jgi:hypothetical protein|nr:hypothetical protein [Prevotellaceae bacterium]
MGQAKERMMEIMEEKSNKKLAQYLGISYDEFCELEYTLYKETSNDDDYLVYNYILDFSNEANSKEILSKIERLEGDYQVWIDAPTYENL